jgi:hypothetical protein
MSRAEYGLRVYRSGVELKSDGRKRDKLPGGHKAIVRSERRSTFRGKIRGWSLASAKRLAFILANADLFFRAHLTLTYRGRPRESATCGL